MPDSNLASSTEAQRARPKVGLGAYMMALISAVFVTFGVILIVAFSHLFVGDWVESAPAWVTNCITAGALGLGLLSGWQSLRKAKKRVAAKDQNK